MWVLRGNRSLLVLGALILVSASSHGARVARPPGAPPGYGTDWCGLRNADAIAWCQRTTSNKEVNQKAFVPGTNQYTWTGYCCPTGQVGTGYCNPDFRQPTCRYPTRDELTRAQQANFDSWIRDFCHVVAPFEIGQGECYGTMVALALGQKAACAGIQVICNRIHKWFLTLAPTDPALNRARRQLETCQTFYMTVNCHLSHGVVSWAPLGR